jgi:hypothetical protein
MNKLFLMAIVLLSTNTLLSYDKNDSRNDDRRIYSSRSSSLTGIHARDYFAQPKNGEIYISEFTRFEDFNGNKEILRHVQRTRYAFTKNGLRNYYLEDYVVNDSGVLEFYDTWVYHVSAKGEVIEDQDSFKDGNYTHQFEYPLNHGFYLQKGKTNTTVAILQSRSRDYNGPLYYSHNYYSINLVDIKKSITLGKQTFYNVAVQQEQQYDVCVWDSPGVTSCSEYCSPDKDATGSARYACENANSNALTEYSDRRVARYRYYFAPGKGIIAMQFLDRKYKPINYGFLKLSKSCVSSDINKYRCP